MDMVQIALIAPTSAGSPWNIPTYRGDMVSAKATHLSIQTEGLEGKGLLSKTKAASFL